MLPFDVSRRLHRRRWRLALALAITLLVYLGMLMLDTTLWPTAEAGFWRHASALAAAVLVGAASFWLTSLLLGPADAPRQDAGMTAVDDLEARADGEGAVGAGDHVNGLHDVILLSIAERRRVSVLAYTDAITGLPNRTVIEHMLARGSARSRAVEFRAAILFIGLDGLDQVHDTLGQDARDELLRLVSQRLLVKGLHRSFETKETCLDAEGRPLDRLPADAVLAHFAGEGFVAILPRALDRVSLAASCECIVDAMSEPFWVKTQDLQIRASVGMAMLPDDSADTGEVLELAAQAMQAAKRAGTVRYAFFDKRDGEGAAQERMEAELQQAMVRHELELHYQPKVDLNTGGLRGVEALVRWRHPVRGLLEPLEFIEPAERVGLMAALGRHVLELAVAQCRAWLSVGTRLVVAVNVSPSQLNDPRFVDLVLDTLQAAGVPPELLMIEITEMMAMTDFDATARRLGQLRAAGVKVALDDFGIGYSNLSQLALLPLDVVKIDRALVQGIGQRNNSEAIIFAIVSMTRALGCHSVAEGIETAEQFDFLRAHGCDGGQGFLFARPMSSEVVAGWRLPMSVAAASPDLPAGGAR